MIFDFDSLLWYSVYKVRTSSRKKRLSETFQKSRLFTLYMKLVCLQTKKSWISE